MISETLLLFHIHRRHEPTILRAEGGPADGPWPSASGHCPTPAREGERADPPPYRRPCPHCGANPGRTEEDVEHDTKTNNFSALAAASAP